MNTPLRRSGMAHVLNGSQSFTFYVVYMCKNFQTVLMLVEMMSVNVPCAGYM